VQTQSWRFENIAVIKRHHQQHIKQKYLQGLQLTTDNTKITDHCLWRKKFGVKNEFSGKFENLRFLRVLGQTVAGGTRGNGVPTNFSRFALK